MDYFAITIFNIYFAIEHLYRVKISIFEYLGCIRAGKKLQSWRSWNTLQIWGKIEILRTFWKSWEHFGNLLEHIENFDQQTCCFLSCYHSPDHFHFWKQSCVLAEFGLQFYNLAELLVNVMHLALLPLMHISEHVQSVFLFREHPYTFSALACRFVQY